MYESTIHWSSLELASSSSWIVGSATFRIVLPTLMTSRLHARTTSACQRRAYGVVVDIATVLRSTVYASRPSWTPSQKPWWTSGPSPRKSEAPSTRSSIAISSSAW